MFITIQCYLYDIYKSNKTMDKNVQDENIWNQFLA